MYATRARPGANILARSCGVRLDDTNYIDLYTEYRRMLSKREKVSYIVAALAVKYAISERKVYALIKRFQTDCNLFAV